MERELADNLKACATAFASVKGWTLKTLGQRAAGDWRFFTGLDNPGTSFTVRKYDLVMAWFAANWPERTKWPRGVPRPEPAEPA